MLIELELIYRRTMKTLTDEEIIKVADRYTIEQLEKDIKDTQDEIQIREKRMEETEHQDNKEFYQKMIDERKAFIIEVNKVLEWKKKSLG